LTSKTMGARITPTTKVDPIVKTNFGWQ
jgi:hypothetical protein